jgi:hypothetical protein
MAGITTQGSCSTLWNDEMWKRVWERAYENPPTYTCKFFYTYRTSPLFGIFKIRS